MRKLQPRATQTKKLTVLSRIETSKKLITRDSLMERLSTNKKL